jgi:hypothetical protein
MTDFREWTERFRNQPGYNDTETAAIVGPDNSNWLVLGVHKLGEGEKDPGRPPTVFFDVLCKQDERDGFRAVYFEWPNIKPTEQPGPAFASKPPHEVPDIAIPRESSLALWIQAGQRVEWLEWPDSYFVVFREAGAAPDPDPIPGQVRGTITVRVHESYLAVMPRDEAGYVTFIVPIYR